MSVFDVDLSQTSDFIREGDFVTPYVNVSKVSDDCINLKGSQTYIELRNDSKEVLKKYISFGIQTIVFDNTSYVQLDDFDFQGVTLKSDYALDIFPYNSIKYRNVLKNATLITKGECSIGKQPERLQTVRSEYVLENSKIDCEQLVIFPGMYNYVLKDTSVACENLILLYTNPDHFDPVKKGILPEKLLKSISFARCKAIFEDVVDVGYTISPDLKMERFI